MALLEDPTIAVREIDCGSGRSLLCVDIGNAQCPKIVLVAGVHGDEPAGPWALLELVESGELSSREWFSYRIWPCTNPSGFDAGTRGSVDCADINRTFADGGQSPEARAILRANRQEKFLLSIDLHEDCDALGFYCYAYDPKLARAVIGALDTDGSPIQSFDDPFDLGSPLPEGTVTFQRGLVHADPVMETQAIGGLSYSLAMAARGTGSVLTFETPARLALEWRIAMHQTAVLAALDALK